MNVVDSSAWLASFADEPTAPVWMQHDKTVVCPASNLIGDTALPIANWDPIVRCELQARQPLRFPLLQFGASSQPLTQGCQESV